MATVIHIRPYIVNWSKNTISYILQTDTPIITEGLVIEIRLYFKRTGDEHFQLIHSQPCYPDTNGMVNFLPQYMLDTFLEYHLPDPTITIPQKMDAQTGQFFITYRETTLANPNASWANDEVNIKYIIKGGLSVERWHGPNYFIHYLGSKYSFLTWQMSGRLCAINERMYLYLILPRPPHGIVSVKVKVVYTDNTENNSIVHSDVFAGGIYNIYALTTGAAELGLATLEPLKKIYYYEIMVEDQISILANAFRYYIDYRHHYNTTTFHYTNSIGGMDSVRVLGEQEGEIQRSFETGTFTTSPGSIGTVIPQQEVIHAILLNKEFKGNLGYLQKNEAHYLIELFASAIVLQYTVGRWWPVIITNKNIPQTISNDDLITLPVQWKYTSSNTQLTPSFATLGLLPVCPVVTNVAVEKGLLFDKITWSGSPGHIKYVIEYVLQGPTPTDPITQGKLFSDMTSVMVPHSNYGGKAQITAISTVGNLSRAFITFIGGPV